jgi:quercetin 2,3-dioxygenase
LRGSREACPAGWPALLQDTNVFVAEDDAGVEHSLTLASKRQAYMVCIEGQVDVNGVRLDMRDAAELVAGDGNAVELTLKAGDQGAHFLLIEMAKA